MVLKPELCGMGRTLLGRFQTVRSMVDVAKPRPSARETFFEGSLQPRLVGFAAPTLTEETAPILGYFHNLLGRLDGADDLRRSVRFAVG
jgi:hypothetical protein